MTFFRGCFLGIISCFIANGLCYGQATILGKMKVEGPTEAMIISPPEFALLRVESSIANLSFDSNMAKSLHMYKHGESAYDLHLPAGPQEITIFAHGYENLVIAVNVDANKAYLLRLDPDTLPNSGETIGDTGPPTGPDINAATKTRYGTNPWGRRRNWSFIGAIASGVLAGVFKKSGDSSFDSYQAATSAEDAKKFRSDTESSDGITAISAGVSVALLSYAIFSWSKHKSYAAKSKGISLGLSNRGETILVGLEWELP